jgi:hypothetical protein
MALRPATAAIRNAATLLVEEGLLILPVHPDHKGKLRGQPIRSAWAKRQYQGSAWIKLQWPDRVKLPLLGLATGRIDKVPGAVFVIDIAPEGDERWKLCEIINADDQMSKTRGVKTPQGHYQYHFLVPPACEIPTCEIAPGITVQGQGGRVIMPPSVTDDGGVFTWISGENRPPVLPPMWLYEQATGRFRCDDFEALLKPDTVTVQVPDSVVVEGIVTTDSNSDIVPEPAGQGTEEGVTIDVTPVAEPEINIIISDVCEVPPVVGECQEPVAAEPVTVTSDVTPDSPLDDRRKAADTVQVPASGGIPATPQQGQAEKILAEYIAAEREYRLQKGYSTHPVGSNPNDERWFKSPLIPRWQQPHNNDWIKEHWSKPQKYIPMLGIATGRISGFFVFDIDIDSGGGKTGDDSLQYLIEKHGLRLNKTYTVRTQSGGLHYYYNVPDDDFYQQYSLKDIVGSKSFDVFEERISHGKAALPPCLDLRACGGQVIVPPSVTFEGKYYVALNNEPIADPPSSLLKLVRRQLFQTPVQVQVPCQIYQQAVKGAPLHWWVRSAIDDLITELAATTEGGRDDAVFNRSIRAGEFIKGGLVHYDDIRPRLVWASQQNGVYYDNPEKYENTIDRGLDQGMTTGKAVEIPPECLNSNAPTGKGNNHVSATNIQTTPYSFNTPADGQAADETSTAAGAAQEGEQQEEVSLPPVPLDAFPLPLRKVIIDAADSFSCPIEVPVAAVLSFLSALVGGSRHLKMKDSHYAHGVLWIATVGTSGSGKSACTRAILNPLHSLEGSYRDEYEAKMVDYGHIKTDYDIAVKAYKTATSQGKQAEMPQEPATVYRRRVFADDATTEAVAKVLRGNPKGITMQRDELSGILFDLDKYTNGKGGGFKARLLQAQDGGSWQTDRAGEGKDIYVRNAWIGITGTIQPGVLSRAFEKPDVVSGFLPRFILIRAIQDKPHTYNDRSFSPESQGVLQRLTNVLSLLQPTPTPLEGHVWDDDLIQVSPEAFETYKDWHNAAATSTFYEMGGDSEDNTILMKTAAKVLSICLLLTLAEAALSPNGRTEEATATADHMRRAIQLGEWLQAHYTACMTAFRGREVTQEPPLLQAVRKVIVARWGEIQAAGAVSSPDLTEWVNQELGNAGATVSSDKIGKAAASLGLKSCRMGSKATRGRLVTVDDVIRLQAGIKSETVPAEPAAMPEKQDTVTYSHLQSLQKPQVAVLKPLIDGGSVTTVTSVTCLQEIKNNPEGDFFTDTPYGSGNIEESPSNSQFKGLLAKDCDLPDTVPDPVITS